MKKLQQGYAAVVVLVWVMLFLVAAFGWLENVVRLIHTDPIFTGMGIARIAGVFMVPLGVVLGYIG